MRWINTCDLATDPSRFLTLLVGRPGLCGLWTVAPYLCGPVRMALAVVAGEGFCQEAVCCWALS